MTAYTVAAGQTSNALAIGVNDSETVQSGGTSDGSVVNGGDVTIESGGVANGTMLLGTGLETVQSGGTTNDTTVLGGSVEYLTGGTANRAAVGDRGILDALTGSMAIGTTVTSGGIVNVLGGSAQGTILGGNTFLNVYSGSATGTMVGNGGAESVSGTGATTGSTIANGGREVVGFGGTASGTIVAIGGAIDLTSLSYADGGSAVVDGADNLTVTIGGNSYTQTLSGDYTGDILQLVQDSRFGTLVEFTSTACYCRETLILTDRGEVPVEVLGIGDRVITASGSKEPIRWIGRRSYAARFLARRRAMLPVRIRAGALGDGLPRRDLRISPLHAMFLDGELVPAELLVNGVTIVREDRCTDVEYFHIELARHDVILAEGAPSETYLDDGARYMFHNAAEYDPPGLDASPPGGYCAPRVESGFALQQILRRLRDRAGAYASAA